MIDSNVEINKIRDNKHVLDVYSFEEYMSWGTLNNYFSDRGEVTISLIGTIPKTKKIISGSDLNDNTYEMICPSRFMDFDMISNNLNVDKAIKFEEYIGEKFNVKILNEFDVTLKLVGVFDETYDYSSLDSCYVNHATLKEINSKYDTRKKDIDGKFVLLDDISNASEVLKEFGSIDYTPIVAIDTEVGDNVLKVTSILSLILIVIAIVFCYALSSRRINKEKKNIGIFKICGFKNNTIKKIFILENIIIASLALMISVAISYFITLNIPRWFLVSDPMLYIMKVDLSYYVILLGVVITYVSLLLSTKMALREIDTLDVGEIIYD